MTQKKPNLNDPNIKMRILKALSSLRPVGIHKDLILLAILRNMKRPNIITVDVIQEFCNTEFEINDKNDEKIEFESWNDCSDQMKKFLSE